MQSYGTLLLYWTFSELFGKSLGGPPVVTIPGQTTVPSGIITDSEFVLIKRLIIHKIDFKKESRGMFPRDSFFFSLLRTAAAFVLPTGRLLHLRILWQFRFFM